MDNFIDETRRRVGLARSILIYHGWHGLPWRQQRQQRFYAPFIRPGDLCFDLGAHVGGRLRVWLALGARIVAVEPQPQCMRLLRRWYGGRDAVTLVEAAVGAATGTATLYLSQRTPTMTTLSADWIDALQRQPEFRDLHWERTLTVATTTLDELIARHGRPAFCKIDVEGGEAAVLAGLSQPLPGLSVEYLPAHREGALACLDRLRQLGRYEFNWSVGESHRLGSAGWLDGHELERWLCGPAAGGKSGDIYARLATGR